MKLFASRTLHCRKIGTPPCKGYWVQPGQAHPKSPGGVSYRCCAKLAEQSAAEECSPGFWNISLPLPFRLAPVM